MEERFELERFEWSSPDRLEVAGRFHGLQEPPAGKPVLVVSGGGGDHRLSAVDEIEADGESWRAQFVWDDTPVGVEAAALELGPDIVVDLPPPGAKNTLLRPRAVDGRDAPHDIALEADLLAAEQREQELRAALARAEAELERARSDLEAERSGRAADAERFRDGLARVRASAEQALADAQAGASAREEEAREARAALEAGEATRAELSHQLETAEAARAEAATEAEALRAQVAASEAMQQRLSALEAIGAEAGEVRAEAQRLLKRLTKMAETLDAGK